MYSLGAILYELLGGRIPHSYTIDSNPGKTMDTLMGVNPRPLADVAPEAPVELVAICEKAMALAPSKRYASARALADDLSAWLEGRVVEAFETGRLLRFRKWKSRNRPLSRALEALVVLVVASTIALLVQDRLRIAAVEAKSRDNEQLAYTANLHSADLNLQTLRMNDARLRLDACPPELRGWEWRHLDYVSDASSLRMGGDDAEVRSIDVDERIGLYATAHDGGKIRLWDARDGSLQRVLEHPRGVGIVRFRPAANQIASGADDGAVRLLHCDDASRFERIPGRGDAVQALAVSLDGRFVATCDGAGRLLLCTVDERSDTVLTDPEAPGRWATAVAFAPEGRALAAGYATGEVLLWDVASEKPLARNALDPQSVAALAFSPPGDRLFAAIADQVVAFDAGDLTFEQVFTGHVAAVNAVAVDGGGRHLLTASADQTVRRWDVSRGTELEIYLGHVDEVSGVAFLGSGERFLSGSEDRTARLWSTGSEAVLVLVHENWVTSLAFRADGERLVSGSRDGTFRVWDAPSGELVERVEVGSGEEAGVDCVGWTADGSVVFGIREPDLLIDRGGDAGAQTRFERLDGHGHHPTAIAVHAPSGRILARYVESSPPLPGEHSLSIWEPGKSAPFLTLDGLGDGWATAFHPGGRTFATATGDLIHLRRVEDGVVEQVLRGAPSRIAAIAFHADGSLVAAAAARSILIWSEDDEDPVATLEGHEEAITSIAFSPAEDRLASGSLDGTVRVWDTSRGTQLLTLRGHESNVLAVAFSPDGSQIASASQDKTVRLWRAKPRW